MGKSVRGSYPRPVIGLDSPWHWALLLIVALVCFGPKRLPEIGRSLGAGIRELKDALAPGADDHDAP